MKTSSAPSFISQLKVFVVALALVIGVQYVSAAWTGPSATAPDNNTAAPLNVDNSLQQKLGSLVLNTDTTNPYAVGLTVFGQIQIVDGTQAAGSVLVSDGSGKAHWAATSTLGLGGTTNNNTTNINGFTHQIVLTSGTSWTVPAGITKIEAIVVAGGGGGAGGAGYCTGNCYTLPSGNGGGSGSDVVADITLPAGTPSLSYSIGSGGVGGQYEFGGGSGTGPTLGASGNVTTFDGLSAGGGSGGGGGSTSYPDKVGGAGGIATDGQTPNVGTATSLVANNGYTSSGYSGANGLQSGGPGGGFGAAGYSGGSGYGAGGGASAAAAPGNLGGTGASGAVIIQY